MGFASCEQLIQWNGNLSLFNGLCGIFCFHLLTYEHVCHFMSFLFGPAVDVMCVLTVCIDGFLYDVPRAILICGYCCRPKPSPFSIASCSYLHLPKALSSRFDINPPYMSLCTSVYRLHTLSFGFVTEIIIF